MAEEQTTFKRIEKKYLITDSQYEQLMEAILLKTNPDCHKRCTIFNIYFDTPNHLLIRRSLDKPVYKEKLRLRSYGMPHDKSPVFVEIKKKYKNVVYKRRAEMNYEEALSFLQTNKIPQDCDQQILREISWFLNLYKNLSPAMLITYDRAAYDAKENRDLRITFDANIRWQNVYVAAKADYRGSPLLQEGQRIMEIKIPNAMPLWLAELLAQLKIYPVSFSKYGAAYYENLTKGEINYA
ncbi:MAG: polyphosphate polymerase domain-containing protein [Clostridiales bacterium]|nr:polyphosphate polymerase domain-containing protein [Clostridiales bacterium]